MKTDFIAVILLAAGASTRLGKPKQLLRFRGESLLRRSAKTALAVSNRIVVTLGANVAITRREIEDFPVEIIENKDWKSGMSGSIRCGLEKLLEAENNLQAVILTICDQPFADANLLEKIIFKFRATAAPIVACEYENTRGVPALFHRKLFPELLALDAQTGAKRLIKKYELQTEIVAFPAGAFDIDTPADYDNLLKNFS